MDFNFFDWLRNGVRRSVLLGVSDAVEQIGAPTDEKTADDQLLSFFREQKTKSRKRVSSSSSNTRKLGRTMKEIQAAGATGKAS